MLVPAAMNIETAIDSMKHLPEWMRVDQRKELYSALGEKSEDFQQGYELGLATARVILAGSVRLALNGVKPEDVL